jgi:hypothetical protein
VCKKALGELFIVQNVACSRRWEAEVSAQINSTTKITVTPN